MNAAAEAYRRGRQAIDEGDLAGALAIAEALVEDPAGRAEGLCLRGVIARLRNDLEGSAAALERALELAPEHVDAHLESAHLYLKTRDLEQALDHAAQTLALDPHNARAYLAMGQVYSTREELREAIQCIQHALELDAELVEAYEALGWIYLSQKRHREAIEMYEQVLERDPGHLDAQHLMGFAFVRGEEYDKGVELFTRVCERTPHSFIAGRVNLANAYFHTGRFDAARRVYEQILAQEPHHFEARWNRSHLLLSEQRFAEGWHDYEYRVFLEMLWRPRPFPFRPWKGEPLEGRSVLVISEQGLGDEIMFASCIPDLLARAARVVIECGERLAGLFGRSFPGAEIRVRRQNLKDLDWIRELGRIDFQVYMGTLPRLLRASREAFPRHAGYLKADPARVARWKERLATLGPGHTVGLSWRGGTSDTRRAMRSIPLEQLRPLLELPGLRFVSLQYGDCAAELSEFGARSGIALAHWQDAIDDYDETAALVAALDHRVSVCTAVIHLAGALGLPVSVMVPAVAEWRYGRYGETMPWYPAVRLHRALRIDDWAPVLDAVRRELPA